MHCRKSQGSPNFHGNPWYSSWDISVYTKVVVVSLSGLQGWWKNFTDLSRKLRCSLRGFLLPVLLESFVEIHCNCCYSKLITGSVSRTKDGLSIRLNWHSNPLLALQSLFWRYSQRMITSEKRQFKLSATAISDRMTWFFASLSEICIVSMTSCKLFQNLAVLRVKFMASQCWNVIQTHRCSGICPQGVNFKPKTTSTLLYQLLL